MAGPHEAIYEALDRHVRKFFEGHRVETRRWKESLPGGVPDDFRVLEVAPKEPGGVWIYLSVGTWENEHRDRCSFEFLIIAPEPSEVPVQLLTMSAHYDRFEHLDVGHAFPIGQPWLPGSSADWMLVSLPYPFGPKLEVAWIGEKHVRYLWLLPITDAERAYRMKFGLDALEDEFEAKAVEYWRVDRRSVVAPPDVH